MYANRCFLSNQENWGNMIPVTTQELLLRYLNDHYILIACFAAPWCFVCESTKKETISFARNFSGRHSFDIPFLYIPNGDNILFREKYSIDGYPTFVIFKNGQEINRVEGADFKELDNKIAIQIALIG
jgi:thiol-disulfide isomerase/thioredoxin